MIKVDKHYVEVSGDCINLSKELVFIMKTFIEKGICSKSQLKRITEIACMDEEEMRKEAEEARNHMKQMLKDLSKILKSTEDLFNESSDDDSDDSDDVDDFFADLFKE